MVAGTPPRGEALRIAAGTAEGLGAGVAYRSTEIARLTFHAVSAPNEIDAVVADEGKRVAFLTQVLTLQVFFELDGAILFRQEAARPQMIIKVFRCYFGFASLVVWAVQFDTKFLFLSEIERTLFSALLGTSPHLLLALLCAYLAQQKFAGVTPHWKGGWFCAYHAGMLLLVVVRTLY